MGRVQRSIEIRASPGKVWEMLALDRWPEWMEEYKSSEYTSEVHTPEDKYRVGAFAHMIEKDEEFDAEITESIENEKISGRTSPSSRYGNITLIGSFALKPAEAGTEVTYVVEYEMPWEIPGKILEKLFAKRALEKDIEKELKNIKSIPEKRRLTRTAT